MINKSIIAKCSTHKWPFYFLGREAYFLIFSAAFICVLFGISNLVGVYEAFFLIGGVTITLFSIFGLSPAYKRAEYIKKVGRYEIKHNEVQYFDSNGKVVKSVCFAGRKVSLRKKGSTSDILVGEELTDFLSTFASKEKLGPVELCKLENGQEVFEYMSQVNSNST